MEPIKQTNDIVPLTYHEQEFLSWVKAARQPKLPRAQTPINELRAEHHLMDKVLAAMEREARKLAVHGELRVDCWQDVVDFIGNYVHQCHRRKEEQGLFPVALQKVTATTMQPITVIAKEHEQAKQLTLDVCYGVGEGDWERVVRASHVYLRVAKEHIEREEEKVFTPLERVLFNDINKKIRAKFDAIEKEALGERDRAYYLEVARRLCERTGLPDPLDGGS